MSIENSQIVWPVNFVSTVIADNKILPNSYTINISIIPLDNIQSGISTGYKKIKYFLENCIHNSVFISAENPLLENFSSLENNVVVFPRDPYDFHVGSVLYSKFVAISEKYFHIDVINIDSAIGDSICYSVSDLDRYNIGLESEHWWNMDSTYTGFGKDQGWGDLTEYTSPRFEPKIIKGGKNSDH